MPPRELVAADVVALLPGPTARGLGEAYVAALAAPMRAMDAEVYWLRRAVEDLDTAAGGGLDLLGDWTAEWRFGLPDCDYRLMVGGRRVALAAGVTATAVWRCWTRLAGSEMGTMREVGTEVLLTAEVDVYPSDSWRQRAADIMRAVRACGVTVYGCIETPDALDWGVHTFDDASFALDMGA